MIDPAILRPGRLDVKIKIERPDAESARDIFSKYILPTCRCTGTTSPSTAATGRHSGRP
jgi:SpoVK/Ycf46/Vps4 family AAA+-type ATPase